jgi:hypothetical protein
MAVTQALNQKISKENIISHSLGDLAKMIETFN